MSCKYLGSQFDIHGGGMDLVFPHHEAEIAQCCAANRIPAAKYWLHNNMITIGGQKMGKSLGNFITLSQFFNGDHEKLEQSYHPMVIKFFILQAHYRSTVDFSNKALQASEKGLLRLFKAIKTLYKLEPKTASTVNISVFKIKCQEAINDDLNTPVVLSHLFDMVKIINSAHEKMHQFTLQDINEAKALFQYYINDIFGLSSIDKETDKNIDGVMNIILDIRSHSKKNKDWDMADKIRKELGKLNIEIQDKKDGATWDFSN
tara:strand:- start:67 stop:849 length:783 start_codon:yes stop_codon:yes gene_type:complete